MEFLTKNGAFVHRRQWQMRRANPAELPFPAFDKVRIGNQPEDRRGIEVGYGSDNVGRADEVIE